MKLHLLFSFLIASTILLSTAANAQNARSTDVVVYGGTGAGITAAIEIANSGKHVILIEPGQHLGGLTSSGLGWTDVGDPNIVGGLSREFYHRIYEYYQNDAVWKYGSREKFASAPGQRTKAVDPAKQVMWVFEPSGAEHVFNDMVHEANVTVVLGQRLDLNGGVSKTSGQIISVRMENGATYTAKIFIDASYEGDLMAKAGVNYFVGREANAVYGETIDGIEAGKALKNQLPERIDPWLIKNDPTSGLLPSINRDLGGPDGSGDHRIQAYCYRMCLTDVPENRIMIQRPEDFDERQYEILFRSIEAGQKSDFFKLDLMPNRKTDSNNNSGISTDLIGMNYSYPEGDYATRQKIAAAQESWQRGLVWVLQNHPRILAQIRAKYAAWGLPKDEFVDTDHWPFQLYIREARRLIGQNVATEHTLMDDGGATRSIGMGAYAIDSHTVQRYVDSTGHVRNEGDVQIKLAHPYRIDYGVIVPKSADCSNLLVPVCLSASHVAYGSIRMEPVFMVLGQSAGAAASLAIEEQVNVQNVPYADLRDRLLGEKQVLSQAN